MFAQDVTCTIGVIEKEFLQQWHDLAAEDIIEARCICHSRKECVADPVIAVLAQFEPLVQAIEDCSHLLGQGNALTKVWWKFLKIEPSAQRYVEEREALVRGIHGSEQPKIWRHRERLSRNRKGNDECVVCAMAFVVLDEGDQLAKDSADVAAIDFVDDENERWERSIRLKRQPEASPSSR